jgi:hypothetical protein
VAEALRQLAEAHAQPDPTFRTRWTYTRLTAKAALEALREQGDREEQLPSPSTMAEVLNRLGFRLRKVVQAKPQKKIKETDAIFDNIKKDAQAGASGSVKRWSMDGNNGVVRHQHIHHPGIQQEPRAIQTAFSPSSLCCNR